MVGGDFPWTFGKNCDRSNTIETEFGMKKYLFSVVLVALLFYFSPGQGECG